MTQPDGYTPTTAANYDSFAGFAQTTQDEWKAQMDGGINNAYGPLSGVCALLEQVPFIGDLIDMGGGPNGETWGPLGNLLDGIMTFVENICSLFLGTPQTGTTPTSILTGATDIFDQLTNSPLVAGFLTLAEDTGNLLSDVIMGILNFVNDLCSTIMGVDQGGQTTPQTISDGVNGLFNIINGSGFLSGIIDLATTTGSVFLKLLDGLVNFLDELWNMFTPLLDGIFGFTPGGIFGGLNQIINLLTSFLEPLMEITGGILGSLMGVLTDIVSLFGFGSGGSGSGLGTGTIHIPILGDIPILGPIIDGLINMFVGSGSGLTGTGGLGGIINDLLGIFGLGSDSGLGTGDVSVPILGEIPILGPLINGLINMFVGSGSGLSGTGGLGGIIDDLLSLFGPITGLGTGNVSLSNVVGNIPLLGPIVHMVQQIIDTILSFLYGIPIVGGVIEMLVTGLENIPLIGQLIELLVGPNSGHSGASGLGNIFNDIFGLFGNPSNVGSGNPILDAVDNIPILGPILAPFTDLLGNLLSFPQNVIGALTNNVLDAHGNTTQTTLNGIFSGMSALNTAYGAAGGSGGKYTPPTSASSANTVYRATQISNYSSWQSTASHDSRTANTYITAYQHGTYASWF